MATCKTCTYYYRDGFCTLQLYYTSDDHTCPKHTTEEIPLDYDYLYRLCKQYIHICEMYENHEKVKKEHPDKIISIIDTCNEDFFLQCCLNDLSRELSKWKTKK